MKISVISQSGEVLEPKHSISGPLSIFINTLLQNGYELVPLCNSTQAVVSMNVHPNLMRNSFKGVPKARRVLIVWEPRVTQPSNFLKKYAEKFGSVLCPSPIWCESYSQSIERFNWPQGALEGSRLYQDWSMRKERLAIFQSNKFSLIRGENYSLRRNCINEATDFIDVFGKDWNSLIKSVMQVIVAALKALIFNRNLDFKGVAIPFVKVKNYMGYVEDKDEALSGYKYTLVIENSSDYVSEKLFEAIRVGSIPLYVGPKLESFGIPTDLAIACDPFPQAIFAEYSKIKRDFARQSHIRESGVRFMMSDSFSSFQNVNVFQNLAIQIDQILKRSLNE